MGKRESHERPRLRKWGRGFRGDGEKREKAIHEWGRGGCNSWVKVNATAGRDWGHQRAGKDDHHLGLWAQVQPAKWECGGGREGWAYQALSFLSFPEGAKTLPSPSLSPFLRMSGRGGGCSLAHCPLSPSPSHSPHPRPHTVLSRSGGPSSPSWAAAHLRSVLLLPMPTGVGSRSPVPPSPQPGHLCTTLPPPRHICIPTLAPQPHPRTRTRPCPPPSPTRPGSHLRGSAAAAQKAALLQLGSGCCSRLLLLLLLPSSPRCPRRTRGAVTGDARVVSGCHPQFSPPTPRPLAPSLLGLNSRSFQGPRPWPPGTDTP